MMNIRIQQEQVLQAICPFCRPK